MKIYVIVKFNEFCWVFTECGTYLKDMCTWEYVSTVQDTSFAIIEMYIRNAELWIHFEHLLSSVDSTADQSDYW